MKRLILPVIVIMLLVVSGVSAGTYTAIVGMDVKSKVGDSSEAELAFAEGSGDVADEFVHRFGEPEIVYTKFRGIQPDSHYRYNWVIEVTNNKPYGVCFRVKSADGELDDTDDGVGFQVWMTSDKIDSGLTLIWDEEGIDGTPGWYYIGPHETHYLSFEVTTSTCQGHDLGTLTPDTYQGALYFEAQGPSTGTCPIP